MAVRGLVLVCGLICGGAPPAAAAPPDRFDVVVIDAGHGGHDEGAVGRSGLLEKDLVLDISKRLAKRLTERGITVVLTRDGDRYLSLEERTAVANDTRADLFLSIHANAATSRQTARHRDLLRIARCLR